MSNYQIIVLAVMAAYLLGSVPFAILSSRLFGLADPRSYGSKNPGATNVLRSGNKLAALVTLVGDSAKGALAVILAQVYGSPIGLGASFVVLVSLAVFLGHIYPWQLPPAFCWRLTRCSVWRRWGHGCWWLLPRAILLWRRWSLRLLRRFTRF